MTLKIDRIVSLLSGLITIITGIIPFLPDKLKNEYIRVFAKESFPILLFLTFFLFFYQYYIKKKLVVAGVNGEPIKFVLYIKRFNPFLLLYFIQSLHKFHHEMCAAKTKIINSDINSPLSSEGKKITAELLQQCQNILQNTLGEDFSLNVKFFEKKTNDAENLTDISNAVLVTYERVPSKKEKYNIEIDKIPKRSNNEKFVLSKWEPDKVRKLYSIIDSYEGIYKKNLAYDYVFGANSHYWLSNDLKKDNDKKIFTSTSDNYLKYYQSLAVFLLSPPLNIGEHVDVEKVLGLIIFDSIEKNVFHKEYSKQVLGYFSHLFYDYFMTYNVFKQNIQYGS